MREVMARSDRAHHHVMEHKSSSKHQHQAVAAAGFSPPMMSKAQVVYYLCRSGKMEPPHMIEVPHSHCDGLRLRDVKLRLTILRGGGMPNMFSWSCKRMYKNTHIWQDVCDDDSLTPVSGGEYILKGSEYFESSQEKSSKPASMQSQTDRTQDVLQRKFRGAETWLKASGPLSPKAVRDQNCQTGNLPDHLTNQLKNLSLDTPRRPVPEGLSGSSDECSTKTSNGGGEESHDIKVCEVRSHAAAAASSAASAMPPEHACSVSTQTDENGYGYGPPHDYKSSGSSTPTCFGNERRHGSHHGINVVNNPIAGENIPVSKQSSKSHSGKLKRKFGKQQPQGKDSGPKVKMKHSAASCVFLHILSYCGGVDTKMQNKNNSNNNNSSNSGPPTEIASSEYSFDGICRAENKLVMSQNRSPQYSMELHKDQLSYQPMDNSSNRSGPLIPYSSEYFDVKEAVTPLQSSPLQAKSSKAVSSNLAPEEEVIIHVEEQPPTTSSSSSSNSSSSDEVEDDPKVAHKSYANTSGKLGNLTTMMTTRTRTRTASDSCDPDQQEPYAAVCTISETVGGVRVQSIGGAVPPAAAAKKNEWMWSSCTTGNEDLRPLQHWNKNLRLSKRRFYKHWWQAMFESYQAKTLLTRTWPQQQQQQQQQQLQQLQKQASNRFFVGKCRRSRRGPSRSPGY